MKLRKLIEKKGKWIGFAVGSKVEEYKLLIYVKTPIVLFGHSAYFNYEDIR